MRWSNMAGKVQAHHYYSDWKQDPITADNQQATLHNMYRANHKSAESRWIVWLIALDIL